MKRRPRAVSPQWVDEQGRLHRLDGPAVTYPDGSTGWFLHGQQHRDDGPAAQYADGTQMWWHRDQLHRVDGPAVTRPDGSEEWLVRDRRHRVGGPAVIYPPGWSQLEEWYLDGNLHRTDGPAITCADGDLRWHVRGVPVRDTDGVLSALHAEGRPDLLHAVLCTWSSSDHLPDLVEAVRAGARTAARG